MPVILRLEGFKFFFYSNEGAPLEPAHVHVRKAGDEAKFWLSPQVELARNDGFDATTLGRVARMISSHQGYFKEAWNEYFS